MIAKMILPMLGGTPAVWNTCMVFFQAMLLAGYSYAHVLTGRVCIRRQVLLHLFVLLLPVTVLPISLAFGWTPSQSGAPITWLLWLLLLSIGLPFFALSTTAPLLQRWFSHAEHALSKDPYILYAASNLGSMVALLGYPTLIEPNLSLQSRGWLSQSQLWSVGYGLLIALIAVAGWGVYRAGARLEHSKDPDATARAAAASRVDTRLLAQWVLWGFVPSSLMLGATSYITMNIAAIPLLWIIPLVLYLVSFIVVFAKWPPAAHGAMVQAMPLLVVLLVFTLVADEISIPFVGRIILHLLTLFVVALVCHGELARSRPAADQLTAFYLAMSIGGMLGGIFNALIAPVMFTGVAEYSITLVVAGLLLPLGHRRAPTTTTVESSAAIGRGWPNMWRDACWLVAISAWACGWAWWLPTTEEATTAPSAANALVAALTPLAGPGVSSGRDMVIYGAPLLLCYLGRSRPLFFGLGLGVLLLSGDVSGGSGRNVVLHQERTFYGVLKVKWDRHLETHRLVHGNTNHGAQWMQPDKRSEPMTYFHPKGPVGDLFRAFQGANRRRHLAVTGLGAGTLASYGEPGQSLTYYEIDPAVVRIALDPRYFTYCEDAKRRGVDLQIVVGDGRLGMTAAPDGGYDLLILDAFSSDSLPVHLITREAFELYLRKMTSDGVIAVNVSNRYLDIPPVLGNIAEELDLVGLRRHDYEDEDVVPGKYASHWVVMARQPDALGALWEDPRWEPIPRNPALGVWMDNFSNVLSVFDWGS
jgi:hypothetical protein